MHILRNCYFYKIFAIKIAKAVCLYLFLSHHPKFKMKNVTNSMYAQFGYMIIAGGGFLFMPNFVLSIFGMQPVDDVWIRVLGLLALVFATYYLTMIQNSVIPYFRASVWGRYLFCGGLAAFVLLGIGEKPLILFAAAEGGLAVWTHLAMKRANQM